MPSTERELPRRWFVIIGVAVLSLTGCEDEAHPTDPPLSVEVADSDWLSTAARLPDHLPLDEAWLEVGRSMIPGFAGIILHPDSGFVVSLAHRGAEAAARSYVALKHPEAAPGGPIPVGFRYVRYTFEQLYDWRADIVRDDLTDIVTLDVDEARNRLTIGVPRQAVIGAVRSRAVDLGIPERALAFSVVGEGPYTRRDLDQEVGVGGSWIKTETPQGGSIAAACTLGVNARWDGRRVFITNSHCTDVKFALDSAVAFQNHNFVIKPVADEIYDLPPVWNCAWSDTDSGLCRYSDAAIFEWRSQYLDSLGMIAQTTYSRADQPGSTTIFASMPHWGITETQQNYTELYVGMVVEKMGQSTGWTWGYLSDCHEDAYADCDITSNGPSYPSLNSTCFFFNNGPGDRLWCQYEADLYSRNGDSGSPIFSRNPLTPTEPDGPDAVKLLGILWGGPVLPGGGPDYQTTWFSPWSGVLLDLVTFGGHTMDVCWPGQGPGGPGC